MRLGSEVYYSEIIRKTKVTIVTEIHQGLEDSMKASTPSSYGGLGGLGGGVGGGGGAGGELGDLGPAQPETEISSTYVKDGSFLIRIRITVDGPEATNDDVYST